MNKQALLGKLFFLVIIVIVLIGTGLYYQIQKEELQISTGDVTINIEYTPENDEDAGTIIEIDESGLPIAEDTNSTNNNTDVNATDMNDSSP